MKRKGLELNTLDKKLFKFDFNCFAQSIYLQSNTKVISNLKTQRSMLEEALIRKY